MWPLQNEVHLSQGRERWIKIGAERKCLTGASAFSLQVLFLSRIRVISLVFLTIYNIPCSRRQIHVNALSGCVAGTCWWGWFKMINDYETYLFLLDLWTWASVIGCSHMMKMLVWPAYQLFCLLSFSPVKAPKAADDTFNHLPARCIPRHSRWSLKIQRGFLWWPCLKKIKAETPLMFNHLKHIQSENT